MLAREPEDDEENPTYALSGVQGESGTGVAQGRANAGRTGTAIRCGPEPDHRMEAAIAGACGGCVRCGWCAVERATSRFEIADRPDTGVAGEPTGQTGRRGEVECVLPAAAS